MYDFNFLFIIFRCVNEKFAEFWMKNDEKLMKIVPFWWEIAKKSANAL